MKNIGDGTAGSITGAVFLQRFVKDVPWAHLDIAGTAWAAKDKPTVPKGATGWGVRLLNQMIADHYEGQ
jgi:leucyl aminopeptidase